MNALRRLLPDVNEPFLPIDMFSVFKYALSSRNKSDQDTGNYEGKTALMYAVESEISDEEKIEIIKLLIDHGADKNIAGKDQSTASMTAKKLKLTSVIDFLGNN